MIVDTHIIARRALNMLVTKFDFGRELWDWDWKEVYFSVNVFLHMHVLPSQTMYVHVHIYLHGLEKYLILINVQ